MTSISGVGVTLPAIKEQRIKPEDILILPLELSDVSSAARIPSVAFGGEGPLMNLLYPERLQSGGAAGRVHKEALRIKTDYFDDPKGKQKYLLLKAVKKGDEGNVLGFAHWTRPGVRWQELRKDELKPGEQQEGYSDVDEVGYNRVFSAFRDAQDKVMQGRPQW